MAKEQTIGEAMDDGIIFLNADNIEDHTGTSHQVILISSADNTRVTRGGINTPSKFLSFADIENKISALTKKSQQAAVGFLISGLGTFGSLMVAMSEDRFGPELSTVGIAGCVVFGGIAVFNLIEAMEKNDRIGHIKQLKSLSKISGSKGARVHTLLEGDEPVKIITG